MLTAADENSNGRKVDYLDAPQRWRHRDPLLFDFLKRSLDTDQRGVRSLEDANLLPGASYFSEPLPDDERSRQAYFERVLAALKGADLLFFDPDTGLEPSASWGRRASGQYLYWSEVRKAASTGASMLIFQLWKRENRQQTLARLTETLRTTIKGAAIASIDSPFVAFLTACRLAHRERYAVALRLMRERWSGELEAK